jgi:hypothetical protein
MKLTTHKILTLRLTTNNKNKYTAKEIKLEDYTSEMVLLALKELEIN